MLDTFLRQRLWPLSAVVLFLFLGACSSAPDTTGPQPVQSPNDKQQYRLLTLDNEMQVLLISDPSSPKAAASLDVMVGSGDNPEGRGGLAHFLEHMLFLGTDKYPDSAEYERFVTEHGGNRNAYTSMERTNYFFDINAPYLPEALDRFAQFFIAPRFDEQYVNREKNAVQAEYQMGLKSDSRRGLDVLQELMNQDHPFSQFAVGSLDSLADRDGSSVREELLAFYAKFYSANQMRLAVLGPQPLDELETLVVPMFSPVPNHSVQLESIDVPMFEQGSLPMLVQVQPQATRRQLQVLFPVEEYRADYRTNPLSYLGNLVGHEGEGSLLSQLKAEGLAEGLSAGSGLAWRGGSVFSVGITLTEEGVRNYDRVLQLLFAYTDMLRAEGPRESLYDEQSQLAQLNFRFKEKANPINYVSSLTAGMHFYAPEDVLRGPYLMEDYQAPMIEALLQRLVPDNALIILDDASVSTDRVSERYQVPYSVQAVPEGQLARWRSEQPAPGLHLPAANEFIAEDVALVDIQQDNPAMPVVVMTAPRQKIWFAQDEEFRIPKGAAYINFRSPEVAGGVEHTAAAALYTALLKDQVNEFTYPAVLAGLNFSLYKHAQGISLRLSGYNDKQLVLLERLLQVIARPEFDPARFENIRKDMIRGLQNHVAKRPSSQVIDDLREALLYGHWGEEALIAVLEEMDLAALEAFAARFWAGANAEVMIYGNYQPEAAEQVSEMLSALLPATPAPAQPPLRVLKLAPGELLQYPVEVQHNDSVVAWYLQGAGNSWHDRAATAMTAQVMKSGFFDQLRTEQQLGYIVSAFAWSQLDVPGMVMLVQSPVADAETVAAAMAQFMAEVEPALDEAQFARHQQALVSEILRPHKNLWERAEFYWQSIAKKQWDFDSRRQMADAVEALTLENWLAYYQQVFMARRHSLQVVAPGQWDVLPAGDHRVFDSAGAIKAGHDSYVIE